MKSKLKIDKLRISLGGKNYPGWNDDFKSICHFVNVDCANGSIPGSKSWKLKGKPWSNAIVPIGVEYPLLAAHGLIPQGWRAYFELNVAHLDPSSKARLDVYLGHCLAGSRNSLLEHGNVSCVEFAYDVVGESFSNFLFVDPWLRSSNDFFIEDGTTYLGCKSGSRQLVIYDKREELLVRHGLDIGHPLLRIEARMHPNGLQPFATVAQLPNPFSRLWVIDRKKLIETQLFGLSATYRKLVLENSIPPQIAFRQLVPIASTQKKKEFAHTMSLLNADWWDPKAAWAMAPETLPALLN